VTPENELRDSGTPTNLVADVWSAQLAAEGLSNREIGARLHLSHRTISTHLYHVFPKLGVTARSQLAPALSSPA
jgi:hypothetical protein